MNVRNRCIQASCVKYSIVILTSCSLLWIRCPTTANISWGQMAQIIVRKMSDRKSKKWTRLAFSIWKNKWPSFHSLLSFPLCRHTNGANRKSYAHTQKKYPKKINNNNHHPTKQLDTRYCQSRIHTNYIFVSAGYIHRLSPSVKDSKPRMWWFSVVFSQLQKVKNETEILPFFSSPFNMQQIDLSTDKTGCAILSVRSVTQIAR